MTLGGEVAVCAHGGAAALVSVDRGPESELAGGGLVIGAVVTVRLVVGAPPPPDPRLWLAAGTVLGGGVLLTISQGKINTAISNGPCATAVPTARPPAEQAPGPAEPDAESWFRTAPSARPPLRAAQAARTSADGALETPMVPLSAIRLERLGVAEPVEVDGALCARMHFNPPDAGFCRECRADLRAATRNVRRQPRPPLGVLLVDDGRGYPLDRDYVIGREPLLDGDVADGRATPLPVTDAEGSVSRLHLLGLTFSNGVITGTPASVGRFLVTITVTDTEASPRSASVSFIIDPLNPFT